MLTLFFVLPLLAALLCLGLNRVVDSRTLSIGAAASLAVGTVLLIVARSQGQTTLLEQPWLAGEDTNVMLSLGFDAASATLTCVVAGGGAVALLALGLALPAGLRGFGALPATLVLTLVVSAAGLATREPLLLPIFWAALPLLSFVSMRASGGQSQQGEPPVGLLGALFGAVLLLGSTLALQSNTSNALPWIVGAGMFLTGLIGLGLPPFHQSFDDIAESPASVAAPLLGFGLPLLAGFRLTVFATQAALPAAWNTVLQVVGLAGVLICGAAALRERRLRHLIASLASAQFAVLLLALGLNQAAAATIAPGLLVNVALSTVAALLAVALLERQAGTDQIDQLTLSAPLLLPATGFLLAAASAVGVPGTWGFWVWRWLYEAVQTNAPLLVGPLLGGAALLALAWLVALLGLLRTPKPQAPADMGGNALAQASPLLAAAPLVLFGIAPGLAWEFWAGPARAALVPLAAGALEAPLLPGVGGMLGGALALAGLGWLVMVARQQALRRTLADTELPPSGVIGPDALGASLSGFGQFGSAGPLFNQIREWLAALGSGVGWALGFFEQRFFMAGLMLAVVAVILLLLQG